MKKPLNLHNDLSREAKDTGQVVEDTRRLSADEALRSAVQLGVVFAMPDGSHRIDLERLQATIATATPEVLSELDATFEQLKKSGQEYRGMVVAQALLGGKTKRKNHRGKLSDPGDLDAGDWMTRLNRR